MLSNVKHHLHLSDSWPEHGSLSERKCYSVWWRCCYHPPVIHQSLLLYHLPMLVHNTDDAEDENFASKHGNFLTRTNVLLTRVGVTTLFSFFSLWHRNQQIEEILTIKIFLRHDKIFTRESQYYLNVNWNWNVVSRVETWPWHWMTEMTRNLWRWWRNDNRCSDSKLFWDAKAHLKKIWFHLQFHTILWNFEGNAQIEIS